jgi:hypothetical protein
MPINYATLYTLYPTAAPTDEPTAEPTTHPTAVRPGSTSAYSEASLSGVRRSSGLSHAPVDSA